MQLKVQRDLAFQMPAPAGQEDIQRPNNQLEYPSSTSALYAIWFCLRSTLRGHILMNTILETVLCVLWLSAGGDFHILILYEIIWEASTPNSGILWNKLNGACRTVRNGIIASVVKRELTKEFRGTLNGVKVKFASQRDLTCLTLRYCRY